MKLVADSKIPFLRGVLEPYASVAYLPPAEITPEAVRDADALLVRTRTRCDRALLDGSAVKLVVTATIGYDHIDTAYCASHGIQWRNAPGCNASSVAQYVASVLAREVRSDDDFSARTIGVIGVGNVGTKVAALCRTLGLRVLLNDPPRARAEGPDGFDSLERIQEEADIVSLHVPLSHTGDDATFHLADADFFRTFRRRPLFLNSSRGECADTEALKAALESGFIRGAVCDVWENEPGIDPVLLKRTMLATPHIAGYSTDGKANGTAMSVRTVADFFGLDALKSFYPENVPAPSNPLLVPESCANVLKDAILGTYDVLRDDAALRSDPASFESLRGAYPIRREFPAFSVRCPAGVSDAVRRRLRKLGFSLP